MISEDQCMELILENFPRFKTMWEEHLKWWEGDVAGLSNDMAAFSRYVIHLLQNEKETSEAKEIFIFIEHLLVEGSDRVKDAATTCFLENLINATSWGTIQALSFVPLLEKESKEYCKAWDEFTGVKTEGLWDENKSNDK